jgi:hypothetical protein
MCVDYTGLNKACPKVPYPLSRIDQIVDSTAGCETLSFLDAYSGYHQIRMKESDQLATSFITPFGMYCYICRRFDPGGGGGVPGPTSKLSLRVLAQMGRRETEHKGEQYGEPRLVLSCAQGGCACSRGLQAFAREREGESESLSVSPFSRAATPSYEGPGPSFYRCKERAQV